jgi:hypothetical protein
MPCRHAIGTDTGHNRLAWNRSDVVPPPLLKDTVLYWSRGGAHGVRAGSKHSRARYAGSSTPRPRASEGRAGLLMTLSRVLEVAEVVPFEGDEGETDGAGDVEDDDALLGAEVGDGEAHR